MNTHDHTQQYGPLLSRRALLGWAAAGTVTLGLGRFAGAAPAAVPTATYATSTYVALLDAHSPLDAAGRKLAAERFREWWAGCDEPMRRHVLNVFEALDGSQRGSFERAERKQRTGQLEEIRNLRGNPLRDKIATERQSLALATTSIAFAPVRVGDGRVPLG